MQRWGDQPSMTSWQGLLPHDVSDLPLIVITPLDSGLPQSVYLQGLECCGPNVSGMNDPRASWEYLCYSKHYFAYPKCWSSLLQYDFNQEGHWSFLSPGLSNGFINGKFSFHL